MTGHQHKSSKHDNRQQTLSGGPVFEFGPGWGAKTKKWFKKYLFGGDCALCRMTRYVLLFGALLLLFGGPQLGSFLGTEKENTELTKAVIVETVQRGDSKTRIARRAVSDYLNGNGELDLTPGQKVFIEANLVELLGNTTLQTGQIIEFKIEDIANLIHEAEQLSPATRQKWEDYAKKVRF